MKKPHLFSALVLGVAVAVAGQAQAQGKEGKDRDRGIAGTGTQGEAEVAKRQSIQVEGSAQDFGAPAQIVITQDFSVAIGYDSRQDNQVFLNIAPSLDYFFLENISAGLEVPIGLVIGEGDDTLDIGLLARVGYAMNLREAVSLWPRLGLGFSRRDAPTAIVDGEEGGSNTDFVVDAFVPALLHLTPNFFVGAGPQVTIVPGGDNDGVTISLRTTLGGNF